MKNVTIGFIRDMGYTKTEVIKILNSVTPISQPTFDRRVSDGNWLHTHVEKLKELGVWMSDEEAIQRR